MRSPWRDKLRIMSQRPGTMTGMSEPLVMEIFSDYV